MPGIQVFGGASATLGAEQVLETNIKNLAVTNNKIANTTLTGGKIAELGIPAAPTEGAFTNIASIAVPRFIWLGYGAKGEENEIIKKAKHFLGVDPIAIVKVYNVKKTHAVSGSAQEVVVKAWKAETTAEIEIELTGKPEAKDELMIYIQS